MMKTETHGNQKVTTSQKESTILLGTTRSSKENLMRLDSKNFTKDYELTIRKIEGETCIQLSWSSAEDRHLIEDDEGLVEYWGTKLLAQYNVDTNKIFLNTRFGLRWNDNEEVMEQVFLFIAGCNEHRSSYLNETTILEILECGDDKDKRGSITGRPAPADLLGIPIYKL